MKLDQEPVLSPEVKKLKMTERKKRPEKEKTERRGLDGYSEMARFYRFYSPKGFAAGPNVARGRSQDMLQECGEKDQSCLGCLRRYFPNSMTRQPDQMILACKRSGVWKNLSETYVLESVDEFSTSGVLAT